MGCERDAPSVLSKKYFLNRFESNTFGPDLSNKTIFLTIRKSIKAGLGH